MYEALEQIENLIAENPFAEGKAAAELIRQIFDVAHAALKAEDSQKREAESDD